MKTAVTLFTSLLFIIALTETGMGQDKGHPSFEWNNIPLRAALDSLMKFYSVFIVYLDEDVEGKNISAVCKNCDFNEALNSMLDATSLEWISRGNQIILKRQDSERIKRYSTVLGTVSDSMTGEWIAGAVVQLQDTTDQSYKPIRRWCQTNSFGFFSLPRVPSGRYALIIRALGYETVKCAVENTDGKNKRSDIVMIPKDIVMKEVTIEGDRAVLTSVEKFTRGTFHRSVPMDQNQYLLDGGKIYNPAHFGGIESTFNPDALNDVQVMLGGLPPSYGGRIGGIVDLSMRDGSRQRFSGMVGLGSLSSNTSVEGPLTDRTTFLLSGRRSYPDVMMHVFPRNGIEPSSLGSFELTGKVTHRFSGNSQISVSGYLGKDRYSNKADGNGEFLNNNFNWGNDMIDLRWIGVIAPSLFLHSSFVYSRYDFDLQHILNGSSTIYGTRISSDYSIEDFSVSAHAEAYYNEDHTVRAGVELVHRRMSGYISPFSLQTTAYSLKDFSSWETAVYLQDQWRILPKVQAELGGRATNYSSESGYFSAIDPRFSLLISLSEQTRLYGSVSAVTQFVHTYRNSGIFLLYPAIFWYPSSENVRPSNSLHFTLGLQQSLADEKYIVSVESYYRITNNLHEFELDTVAGRTQDLIDAIHLGTGKTYGVTCSVNKRTGSFTYAITYNLSWSLEKFLRINNGHEFAPPFDRRHELQITSSYSIDGKWILNALCVVASGYSVKVPLKIMKSGGVPGDRVGPVGTSLALYEFIDVNGNRMPGFQRLEFNLSRTFFVSRLLCQLSLRFINSYGLIDPFVWELQSSNFVGFKWNASLQNQNLFPLYPSFELAISF